MTAQPTSSPLISVLMPTYNCRPFLAESINCVLAQTLDDLELIIVDDGSTDDSQAILREFSSRDPRMHVVRQENRGAGAALNAALELARGRFLARMDADDLTPSQRFAEQVAFLSEHPEIAVVGGWHRAFGAVEERVYEFPTDPDHLKAALLFRNPISHPTVMMRHDVFKKHGWRYSTRRNFPEDYDLWTALSERHEFANIPKVYLDYRVLPGAIAPSGRRHWPETVISIQERLLARMGLIPNPRQRTVHAALAFDEITHEQDFISAAHKWLIDISEHHRVQPVFNQRGLTRVLTGRYVALCRAAARGGIEVAGLAESPFRQYVTTSLP